MMSCDFLKQIYQVLDIPGLIYFVFITFMIFIMAQWHRGNTSFDFREALLDQKTRKISFTRLGQFVALIVSTGLLAYEATKGRLTEWLFISYMAAWTGSYAFGKYLDSKQPNTNEENEK